MFPTRGMETCDGVRLRLPLLEKATRERGKVLPDTVIRKRYNLESAKSLCCASIMKNRPAGPFPLATLLSPLLTSPSLHPKWICHSKIRSVQQIISQQNIQLRLWAHLLPWNVVSLESTGNFAVVLRGTGIFTRLWSCFSKMTCLLSCKWNIHTSDIYVTVLSDWCELWAVRRNTDAKEGLIFSLCWLKFKLSLD